MQIKNLSMLLNMFVAIFAGTVTLSFAAAERKRVILVYPNRIDPFHKLPADNEADVSTLMKTQGLTWASANLTLSEIHNLNKIIRVSQGVVAENNVILLSQRSAMQTSAGITTTPQFLNDAPLCNASLNGVDFVVIDTVVFQNATAFDNVKIQNGPHFLSNKQPCHPHGSEVVSIIVGKDTGMITSGDRIVYNLGVFDCNGQAFPEQIIRAFNAALGIAATNKLHGRRTVINFSGVGSQNEAINLAATALAKAGTPVFVAAGNFGLNACQSQSPAMALGLFAVGATMPFGDEPADFTNFGNPCVKIFLPGVGITVADVINGGTTKVEGTSFSSPIASALGGLELGIDPKATNTQIFERILATTRTRLVTPSLGSNFDYPMRVMLADRTCPTEIRVFNKIMTAKVTRNRFVNWYDGAENNTFCVTFNAKSKIGSILIGLRSNSTDTKPVKIILGNKHAKNKATPVNVISEYGKNINESQAAKNVLYENKMALLTISVADKTASVIAITDEGVITPMLFAKLSKNINQISFSSTGGGVTYKNANKCTM
jgi:hypothetical protein